MWQSYMVRHDLITVLMGYGNRCNLSYLQFIPVQNIYLETRGSGVIMSAMASQITSVSIVCSTVCSKKTSKLRFTDLCEGNTPITGGFPHKGPVKPQMFPFDDVIMTYLAGSISWLFPQKQTSHNGITPPSYYLWDVVVATLYLSLCDIFPQFFRILKILFTCSKSIYISYRLVALWWHIIYECESNTMPGTFAKLKMSS